MHLHATRTKHTVHCTWHAFNEHDLGVWMVNGHPTVVEFTPHRLSRSSSIQSHPGRRLRTWAASRLQQKPRQHTRRRPLRRSA